MIRHELSKTSVVTFIHSRCAYSGDDRHWPSPGPEFVHWIITQPTVGSIQERPLWSEQITKSKDRIQPIGAYGLKPQAFFAGHQQQAISGLSLRSKAVTQNTGST
jgi:hypothetical protein